LSRIGFLLPLFLAGLLPFAMQFVVHHPDERHYTDAAIGMLQGGDFLVPQHADGSPRFEKPIFTYWVVAGSYALLGVSPLASRLPFLLAGGAALWLTYRLALLLFDKPHVARLAALIWFCHPLLLLSATRSMPDVLLCLFLLATAYGLLGVLLAERPPCWKLYLAAYGGAGLAAATKGLPVLALVLFSAAFARFNPWQPRSLRLLLHAPSMTVGLVLALGWFFLLGAERSAAVQTFWDDQVQHRLDADYSRLPEQLGLAVGVMTLTFLPWALPLLPFGRARQERPRPPCPGNAKHAQARRFIMLWTLFMALLMSLTVKFSVRYQLLVAPFLAILLADALDRADPVRLRRWFQWLLGGALVALLALAGGVTLMTLPPTVAALDVLPLAGAGLLVVVLAVVGLRGADWSAASCLGVALFLMMPLGLLAGRRFILPDQGAQIAASLADLGCLRQGPIAFVGGPGLASKVRVCSGGQAQLVQCRAGPPDPLGNHAVAIVRREAAAGLERSGCVVMPLSAGYRDLPPARLAAAIVRGALPAFLAAHKEEFQLVIYTTPADEPAVTPLPCVPPAVP